MHRLAMQRQVRASVLGNIARSELYSIPGFDFERRHE
jgi:hypothetical protein